MAEQELLLGGQNDGLDPAPKGQRQESLDALRGWALLGMALSSLVPAGTLPTWMYHAQVPPPDMKFDPTISGITWVDLVFPFFLFAMGAALPFSLGRRLEEGEPWHKTLLSLGRRSLLLLVFAWLVFAMRPSLMAGAETPFVQLLGLGFFLGTLLLFIYSPRWSSGVNWLLRGIGLLIIVLSSLLTTDVSRFDPMNQDIIIKVLAGVSFTGGLVYWASRRWAWAPYLVGLIVLVVWPVIKYWPPFNPALQWTFSPLVTRLDYHKYLLIVIPGILYGCWLARSGPRSCTSRDGLVLGMCLMLVPLCFLFAGKGTDAYLAVYLLVLAVGAVVFLDKDSDLWQVIPSANILVFAGVMVSHWGESLRKDSATVSYFLITSGLAILVHQGLEFWRQRFPRKSPGFMAAIGSNPLLGYLLMTNFIFSFVRLTGVNSWVGLQGWNPWVLAIYGLLQTLLIGCLAALATRCRVFMRA